VLETIKKVFILLNKKQRIKFSLLLFGIFVASLFELAGVSLVLPLISVVMDPSILQTNKYLNFTYNFFSINSTQAFLIMLSVILIAAYVIKNIYILLLNYIQYKWVFNEYKDMTLRIFSTYLKQPYAYHLSVNTATIIRTITSDTLYFFLFILNLFTAITEFLIIIMMTIFLFFINKYITLALIVLIFFCFFSLLKKLKRKTTEMAQLNQKYNAQMIKWLNQATGAIKDLKIRCMEDLFIKQYHENAVKYVSAQKYLNFLSIAPKAIIETFVIVTVLLMIIIFLLQGNSASVIFTQVAVFAMAAFRMMPSMNRIQIAVNTMFFHKVSVDLIYKYLKELTPVESVYEDEHKDLDLKYGISVNNISYKYPTTDNFVFKNISFKINRGDSIAFIGQTGSGKTTLIDVILGLLVPLEGTISVGGNSICKNKSSWAKKVGYVPQFIYLTDDSIKNNIVFYDDKDIDAERLNNAIEQAQLKDFISSLPKGLDTVIGERGIRLSGGQRQRIGIARALYNKPEVLILDEATSSLDNETEKAVMEAIEHLYGKITMIIVAHRLTTIEKCNVIYKLKNQKIEKIKG